MRPKIKICGIKTKEEILMLNNYPVDYMGFIFAPSRRQVTMEQVRELRSYVRDDIQVVGVFVNEETERVNEIAKRCKLDIVQLHGNEDASYCQKVKASCWKSIGIQDKKSVTKIKKYRDTEGILVDTYHPVVSGGTGKTFSWDLVKGLSKEYFLILAGGLSPDNIVDAMTKVKPHVLDINSGVETDLMKDEAKIQSLFGMLSER